MEGQHETSFNSISEAPINSTEIHPQSSVTFVTEGEDCSNSVEQETKRLLSSQSELSRNRSINAQDLSHLDGLTETFNKIVKVFGDCTKTGDETDASTGFISMKKMKQVIDRLDTDDNRFHYFMNTIPVLRGSSGIKEEEKRELLQQLDALVAPQSQPEEGKTADTASTTISLRQYLKYAADQKGMQREKTVGKSLREMLENKLRKNMYPGEKLLRYFKAIGEAKKIYISPTKIAIPLMSLLLLIFYIAKTPELDELLMFKT
jgi:hypothetical protein